MNTPRTLSASAAFVLAALTLSGCSADDTTASTPSHEPPAVTATKESATTSGPYVESNGARGLNNTAQIDNEELRSALESASTAGEPFYIDGEQVYWLDRNISYAERDIVETEARNEWQEHGIRSVEGFGTDELTIYRHDSKPYKVTVEQK